MDLTYLPCETPCDVRQHRVSPRDPVPPQFPHCRSQRLTAQQLQKKRPTLYTEAQWLDVRFRKLSKGAVKNGVDAPELLINLDN